MLSTETKIERQHTVRLSNIDIIEHLNQELKASGNGFLQVPSNASVTISIPGGGDWSNTDLDVDKSHPVVIRWTVRETE